MIDNYSERWANVSMLLDNLLNKIFDNINFKNMTDFEKRSLIFDYLSKNIEYDYDLLEGIKRNKLIMSKNLINK